MFIKRSETTVDLNSFDEAKKDQARLHETMRAMPGFRWAMLLRSAETPQAVAAVSMWLSPEQASQDDNAFDGNETHGYDVATARGSMTPATHVALVDWEVPEDVAERFTNRWNAAYHAIEDRIGSRLLRDLDTPGRYAGLHAVTVETNLDPESLGAAVTDAEGLAASPKSVNRYEVVLLTEA